MISNQSRKILLETARNSIASYLSGDGYKIPAVSDPELQKVAGVFVTLTIRGELRGCIGYVSGVKPLINAVFEMAREAAFDDPRFYQLTAEELDEIEIEISVLTPLRRVGSDYKARIGIDGLVVRRGYRSGLLLPQVATEWGYDSEQFIQQTCLKAGMSRMCYNDENTEIYAFQAEIFNEKEITDD